jgi:phospholipid/cholesterol/gamma-HCH transport system substrate-binding protein
MNEPVNKRAAAVGLFVVIGLVFLVAGILAIGNLHSTFSKKITVSTIFGDVNGLQSGNNIWFSGVKIGTVKSTEFYGRSQVKVNMNINVESRQYIRKDAKVKISSDGLIGNKILVIYGGTDAAPGIEEGDVLANETALSTEDIMNTLQQNNLNILALTKKIAAGEGTLGKLINDDAIYDHLAVTTRSLEAASEKAQLLISSLSQFSSKLNKKGTLINDLVTDTVTFNSLKASVFSLQRTMDTVNAVVTSLKATVANPKTPAGLFLHDEQAGAELKKTIKNLESSSQKLDEDLEALQHNFLTRKYFRKKEKEEKKNK